MDVKYIRNLNTSHMVIIQSEEPEDWEKKMAAYNRINGVLFSESVNENDVTELWYNITGKQALDVVLESSKLDYELLCRLLSHILDAAGKLEEILLKPDNLLLCPEHIFMDYKTSELYFCYYPGNVETISRSIRDLTEYLLEKLEHSDERAVKLAYDLYEKTRNEGYSLGEIRRTICVPYPMEEEGTEERDRESKTEGPGMVIGCSEKPKEEGTEAKLRENGAPFWRNLEERIENILPLHYILDGIEKQKWVQKIGNILKGKGIAGVQKDKKTEPFIFEPEPETKEPSNPTVLLSELESRVEGILHYEGNGVCKDLVLDCFPYIIGSGTGCNGYLPNNTVSRKHAKITKKDDVYFIEDLNSSNGTYVGGELLNYRAKTSLQKNESILFAEEKYRFI